MKLASCVWTILMIVLGSVVAIDSLMPSSALAHTTGSIVSASPSSVLQPGVNRVTFDSEGVPLVGNVYLPESYQQGDRLPAVIVTGSWTTVKEQMAEPMLRN